MTLQLTPEMQRGLKNLAAIGLMMERGQKNDPPALTAYGNYAMGETGLFNVPGSSPRVISAVIRPLGGLASAIPVQPAGSSAPEDYGGYDVPLYQTITGVTQGDVETFSNQPNAPCDDAPNSGLLKAAVLTAPYGRYYGSFEIRMFDVGRLRNFADPIYLQNMNLPAGSGMIPSTVNQPGSGVLTREIDKKLYEAGVGFERLVVGQTYTANPTNNQPGGGARQFQGINLLVNTGKVDAISGQAVPRMDSIVEDFGYADISTSPSDIIRWLDSIFYRLWHRSRRMGLGVPDLRLQMREELFDVITEIIPIRYYEQAIRQIDRINDNLGAVNAQMQFTSTETTNMRDDLRMRQVIPIRGRFIPVILDDTIAEADSSGGNVPPGSFESDIYVNCFSVLGGFPTLFWEVFNQANRQAVELEGMIANQSWTTDGGVFRWFANHKNGCLKFQWYFEPRIVQLTPYLCARLQNVAYTPLHHIDSYDPASGYFLNGGRTNTVEEQFYPEYSPTTPVTISGR